MKKIICVLLVSITIFGCTQSEVEIKINNGVKSYLNNKATTPDLCLTMNKIAEIDFDKDPALSEIKPSIFDIVGDFIYTLDWTHRNIIRFNNYKQDLTFSKKGNGPGELISPNAIFINNDTVNVSNQSDKSIVKFDLNGNFIAKTICKQGLPQFTTPLDESHLIGFIQNFEKKDGKRYINYELTVFNNKIESKNKISTNKSLMNSKINMLDFFIPYAVDRVNKKIFVSDNKDSKYSITVLDYQGNKLYKIKKKYRMVKFTSTEIKEFNSMLSNINGKRSNGPKLSATYKKAINKMIVDSQGRLWVFTFKNDPKNHKTITVVDLFKDGIFLKRFDLNAKLRELNYNDPSYQLKFQNNKLYAFDIIQRKISVFEVK